MNWFRRWLWRRQDRQCIERSLRDLLLPTIRMRRIVLTEAAEQALLSELVALYKPGIGMETFSAQVRARLDRLTA